MANRFLPSHSCQSRRPRSGRSVRRRRFLELEKLEDRTLPSGAPLPAAPLAHPLGYTPAGPSSTPSGFTPSQISKAYGLNLLTGDDGTGETIAIIGAYDDPNLVSSGSAGFSTSDLHLFDAQYGISETGTFSFTKYQQTSSGANTFTTGAKVTTDPAGQGTQNWEGEEAMAVEWAHAMAPGAHILLVEAADAATNLYMAASWAAEPTSLGGGGAQVISMGWGASEFGSGEKTYDSLYFVQPSFYSSSFTYGVTYLAATGDGGAPGDYPAYSPNVVAVGATSLALDASGNYSVESGWSDSGTVTGFSGGGVSSYEATPNWQTGLGFSGRAIPDVSFEGAASTPVSVYDSFNGTASTPWYQYYGTSVATPCWAALVGIADQLRAAQSLPSLSGPGQVLPLLYTLPGSDFHDITTGNNGFAAGPGYDLVTGIGTPVANKLVPDLTALRVDASTPGNGVVFASPPTTFNVTFTDPIVASSLHANALTINGIASNGVTLDATKTIATFTFASNPVVSQGPQTMSMAAGAATAQSSSSRTSVAYSATFYYDTLPLAITSTSPISGGSFSLPASTLTYSVNFNQPIDPNLVKTSNLIVTPPSGTATVTSASVLPGNQTAVYTISQTGGFTVGTLTININSGTYKDQYDDPVSPPVFAANYYLEKNIQALPTPLASTAPLGSLNYSASVTNQLLYAGDSNRFTLAADPGETLTVLVTPNSSNPNIPALSLPTVQLSDPSSALLGSATVSTAGQIALLQTIPTTTGGTYTITVGGANGTLGNYTVQVYLDAALETANLGLGADTSVTTAQNLNGAFVNLQTSFTSASRAAVLGGIAQPLTVTASAWGNWDSTGYHLAGAPSFLVGQVPPKQYNDFFVFNLSGINPTILSASLNLSVGSSGYSSSLSSDTFGLFDVLTPIASLVSTGYGEPNIFTDLGSGASYGTKTVSSTVNSTILSTPLNAAGIAALNSKRGSQFAVGGSLTTVSGQNNQYLFAGSGNASDTIQLSLGLADSRFYSFSLAAHELASVGLKNLTGLGGETISIQDGSGNVLASGTSGAGNLDQVISNFSAPAAGTYYVVVSGSNNSTYSLVVTRDASFDQKTNATQGAAQDLTGTVGVLGDLPSSSAVDWYKVTLSGSQNALQVETKIPLAGPSQAINALAPSIGLYNAGGTLLTAGTVLPDGRNQSLLSTGLSSGTTYYVKVTAASGQGEYYLGLTPIQRLTLTSSPGSQSVIAGQPATFIAGATGQPAPTVQWQVSTNGGSSYTPISGATSTTYTISSTSTSQSGNLYEAVFTNPGGSVTTAPATLTVSPAPVFTKYQVTPLISSSTVTAGNFFALQVQAVDQFGNPLTSGYTGPSSVTVSLIPPSTASGFPFTLNLNSNGASWAVVSLVQVGTYAIMVSGGGFSGSSSAITVIPATAAKLSFGVQPANVATGDALAAFTVQVQDAYGNLITSDNTDHVSLGIATGPGAFKSGSTTTVTVSGGTATFTNVTLVTPGTYTLTETVQGMYTGPNSTPFNVIPLQVMAGSFASSPSGFSLQFNAPYLVNSATPILYGPGFGANAPVPSVTLTQTKDGSGNPVNNPVEGSLVLSTANNSITFVATNTAYEANLGSPVLPDGTYTVDVASTASANGFQALNSGGGFLDGKSTGSAGSGDYLTTFTINAAAAKDDVVWVPATADGPGQPLNAPGNNQAGGGYPVYLSDSTGSVTSVQVTLNYNPALLTVTGVTGANFTLVSNTPGQATVKYSGPALASGTQVPLGFLTASVPGGTTANPMPYRAKDLLTLTGLTVTGTHGAVPAVVANALHLVTYVGDADGNGAYSSNDAVLITRVALQTDVGFAAYSLVDPVVVADTDGSGFIPADAALQVNEAGVGFPTTTLPNPAIPPGVHFTIVTNGGDTGQNLPTFTSGTPPLATAGQAYSFTFTASGTPTPTLSASNLPSWLTFNPATGVLSGTPTLATTYTNLQITATNPAGSVTTTFSLTVNPGPVNHLGVSAVASTAAGSNFLFTVQAEDSFNNPSSNFSGTVSFTTTDPQGNVPAPTTVTGGFGFFLATLKTVAGGPWTITATSGGTSGQSSPITVTPGPASKLGFGLQPGNTPTGLLLPTITVQILDPYGNVVTSDNTDVVTLGIASGPGTFQAGSTVTATAASGVASFTNLTLVTPGSYHLSAVVANTLAGPNSAAFTIVPLQVRAGSFAGGPSGFSLQFNTFFLVNSLTPVQYGLGFGAAAPAPSVTVTQTKDAGGNPVHNPVEGSLVLNTTTNSITFVATDMAYEVNTGSPILPDGTYTVTIHSSAATNGFQALNSGGGFLDGLGTGTAGSGDYTNTFAVNAAAMGLDTVWVPDVAEGPGQPLNAPGMNQAGGGYPIYLNDKTGNVTSVQVTLNYNPALLTVTGVTGANFTLASNTPGQATVKYSGPALASGTQIPLGFLTASVPGGTTANPMPYKTKDLLTLTGLSVTGTHGAVPAVVANALHLVSYVGDSDGNGAYNSNDAVMINRVALQADSGFAAFPLVDPVIVADTDGSGFLPADASLQVNEAGVGFPTSTLPNPPIPPGVHFTPIGNNVDPTLSLPDDLHLSAGGVVTVPVNIDDAHPAGSTGLIEAHLALTYDPRQFTVSAADVHLGSVLAAGSGWQVLPTINPMTGEIAIALSSDTSIQSGLGGSLVTIDFHAVGQSANPSAIALVSSVNPTGSAVVTTELEDAQGTFTLTMGSSQSFVSLEAPAGLVTVPAFSRIVDVSEASPATAPVSVEVGVPEARKAAPAGAESEALPAAAASSGLASQSPLGLLSVADLVIQSAGTSLVGLQNVAGSLAGTALQGLGRLAVNLPDAAFYSTIRDALNHALAVVAARALPADGLDALNPDAWGNVDLELGQDLLPATLARTVRVPTDSASQSPGLEVAAVDQYFAQTADELDLGDE